VSSHGQTTVTAAGSRSRDGREPSTVAPGEPRSYYGEPIIAKPVWTPEIPIYFFVGGRSGATAPLTLIASQCGNQKLARRAAAIALAGSLASPALLISDLGRPERFLNMLRMFKVTSPMSVGSWVLSGFGATAAASAARELLGLLPRSGRAAQVAGALLGPLLSTYTAALIAQTAVPAWHEARRELPFVFAAGSLSSAGALAQLVTPYAHAAPARRMAVAGATAELVAIRAMDRRLGALGAPYHQGRLGTMACAAQLLTAAGAAIVATAPRTRRGGAVLAKTGATALLGAALLERWTIFRAGFASADDPKYVTAPQRARAHR
jgi:formate-dependent nitrite reductase membrane component NrfD